MIGKMLKKSSVALHIVYFGEEDEGKTEKLEAVTAAVNKNGSSHTPGLKALCDVLIWLFSISFLLVT